MQDIGGPLILKIPSVTCLATAIRLAAKSNEIIGTFPTKQQVRLQGLCLTEDSSDIPT